MSTLRRLALSALARYFSLVKLPPSFSRLKHKPEDFTIITQSKSIILQSILLSFAKRSHLKGIRSISYSPSHAAQRIEGFAYCASIHEEEILEQIVSNEPNQQFVTFNTFRSRGPIKNTPTHKLSFLKLLGMLIAPHRLLVVFGEPIVLAYSAKRNRMKLSRALKLDFYGNLKILRGNPFQPIDTQARLILSGAEFDREISLIASRTNESKSSLLRKAHREFYGIAANPRGIFYAIVAPLANFILGRLFSSIQVHGIDKFKSAVRDSTVVMVPMHRSHLDYIILGSSLYDSDMNPPLVAAGVNLRFWPIGFFIRSLGGYFVKRNARQDRMHAVILKRYVTYLIKRGHLQEFFIEGGRSRSGKMRAPKIGLLSIMTDAFLKGLRKDIQFVPVSITYENLIEDKVFGDENTGRKKAKENIFSLMRARKIFGRKYGDVIVNFGEAIALSAFTTQRRSKNSSNPRLDDRPLAQELGYTITKKIRSLTNVSLTSLAYTALMAAPRYALSKAELIEQITNLSRLALLQKYTNPGLGDFTPSLQHFLAGRQNILDDLLRGGNVSSGAFLGSEIYFIRGAKRYTADFYKNSTIHLFFLPSLFAVLELMGRDISAQEALPFHALFENDFLLNTTEPFMKECSDLIELFLNNGILSKNSTTIVFTNRSGGLFLPGLLLSSIQSLLWVIHNLGSSTDSAMALNSTTPNSSPGMVFNYPQFLEQLQTDFKTATYMGLMNRTEAASQSNIQAALETLSAKQFIAVQEAGGLLTDIRISKDMIKEYSLLSKANACINLWLQSH